MGVWLELSVKLLFKEREGKKSRLLSANEMKRHSEEISLRCSDGVSSRPKQQAESVYV